MPHKQLIQTPVLNPFAGVVNRPGETERGVERSDDPEGCEGGGVQNELLEAAVWSLKPPGDEGADEEDFHEQGP